MNALVWFIRLYAVDVATELRIYSVDDHYNLQRYQTSLENWSDMLQMKLNPAKYN